MMREINAEFWFGDIVRRVEDGTVAGRVLAVTVTSGGSVQYEVKWDDGSTDWYNSFDLTTSYGG